MISGECIGWNFVENNLMKSRYVFISILLKPSETISKFSFVSAVRQPFDLIAQLILSDVNIEKWMSIVRCRRKLFSTGWGLQLFKMFPTHSGGTLQFKRNYGITTCRWILSHSHFRWKHRFRMERCASHPIAPSFSPPPSILKRCKTIKTFEVLFVPNQIFIHFIQ